MIGGCVYAEIYCNAAVQDSVSADFADFEAHVLDLLRCTLHDRVGIWDCQRDSVSAVDTWDDMGIGTAGYCDTGDCVSRKSVWHSDACGEIGNACRSDGKFFAGKGILKPKCREHESI